MVGGKLTRLHLWLGELLGIMRYESCWGCKHARWVINDPEKGRDACACDACLEEDGVMALVNPCEAVWCDCYEEMGIRKAGDDA